MRAAFLAALLRLSAFRFLVRAAFFAASLRFCGPWFIQTNEPATDTPQRCDRLADIPGNVRSRLDHRLEELATDVASERTCFANDVAGAIGQFVQAIGYPDQREAPEAAVPLG